MDIVNNGLWLWLIQESSTQRKGLGAIIGLKLKNG